MRVFSGIKPTGIPHIGNYLGAIKQWLDLQKEQECVFSVVDLHAVTVPQDPTRLKEQTLSTAALLLACGIDPKKQIFFIQSHVAPHAELAWILSTLARFSELKLMHQFKEKSKGKEENIGIGLFCYPILMAADILLYKTQRVPVGEDQMQHIELTRELARRFNARFGETFIVPEGFVPKIGARIMALDDPTRKMEKSAESVHGYISLTDSPDQIRKKIQRAVTDSGSDIVMSQKKPALSNLMTIYQLFSGLSIKDIEKKYRDAGYKEFKHDLSEVLISALSPIQERYADFMRNQRGLEKILQQGAVRAQEIASKTLQEAKSKMGFIA